MFIPASFCDQCGAKLQKGARYCIMCGVKLSGPMEELVEKAVEAQIQEPVWQDVPENEAERKPQIITKPDFIEKQFDEPESPAEPEADNDDTGFVERNVPPADDTGEETVYLGVGAVSEEPESIEQKFSRMAPISVLFKERSGEKITIDRPEFVLGKNPNHADFAVRDNNTVSRIHASITWSEDGYRIVDLGSMNGTYVNGKSVDTEGQIIADGDLIELADERFRVQLKGIGQR